MEGLPSTVPPSQNRHAPPAHGGSREKQGAGFMAPQDLNNLKICKGTLTQVTPSLPPRANTKECGVQVNARVDKSVQCSLGPKKLFCDDHLASPKSSSGSPDPCTPERKEQYGTPAMRELSFLRSVSIYSPVFDRRVCLGCDGSGSEGEAVAEKGAQPEDDRDPSGEEAVDNPETTSHRSPKISNFLFLEQMYGFFHCKMCNIRWESAYVWCIAGTSKVYYKQLCRKCQVSFNPYRVESILCQGCSLTSCSCEKKQRHINMRRPHRQDLCCRCRGMRLSCDATYRFKYIA